MVGRLFDFYFIFLVEDGWIKRVVFTLTKGISGHFAVKIVIKGLIEKD